MCTSCMCFQAELEFSVTSSIGVQLIVDLTYNKHNSWMTTCLGIILRQQLQKTSALTTLTVLLKILDLT